mgnify:CR=1 FL=1
MADYHREKPPRHHPLLITDKAVSSEAIHFICFPGLSERGLKLNPLFWFLSFGFISQYEFTPLLVIGNMFKVVAMIDLCHKNRNTVWTKVQWRICFCFLMITDRTIQSLITN